MPGDDDQLHFVGALPDHHQGSIAVQPLNGIFPRIAVGAENPHGLGGAFEGCLGGKPFCHTGLQVHSAASVIGARGVINQKLGGAGFCGHGAQLDLDRLVLGDGFTHGFAHLRIGDRLFQSPARHTHGSGGDIDPAHLQAACGHQEAPAFLTAHQTKFGVTTIIFKADLAGVDTLVPQFLQLAAPSDSRQFGAGVHVAGRRDQHGHATMARLRIWVCLDQQGQDIPLDDIGDPQLGAIDHIVGAITSRPSVDALQVGPSRRFGQAQTAANLCGGEFGEPVGLLRLRAEFLHHQGHHQMGVEHTGQAHPFFGNSGHNARIGQGRQPQAAIFSIDQGAEQTHFDHVVYQILGIFVGMLQLGDDRRDLLVQPAIDGVEQGAFVVVADRRHLTSNPS